MLCGSTGSTYKISESSKETSLYEVVCVGFFFRPPVSRIQILCTGAGRVPNVPTNSSCIAVVLMCSYVYHS